MNKVLVLGSNSFSGAFFVNTLLDNGHQVYAVSRSIEPNSVFLPYKNNNKKIEFYQYDINHNLKEIIQLLKKEKIGYVVNFAAQSMVGQSWDNPKDWFITNAVSTTLLFEQFRYLDFLDKYVHISTPEVYGTCSGVIKEHSFYNPSTPYATSRAAGDMSLKNYVDVYGLPAVSTRAANVYGPYQQLYRIIPKTVLFLLLNKKLQLHGGGKSVRSFIHMSDVVDGTIKAMEKGIVGDVYHLSTKNHISIRELVEMICEILCKKFEDNVEIVPERQGKDNAYLLDSSKASDVLGWKDKVSLDQGLEETIKWVKDNLKVLEKQPIDYKHKA